MVGAVAFHTISEHFGQRLPDGLAEERRNRISNLLDDLRPIAGKLKIIIERLKPRAFTRSQSAIAYRMDATIGGRMNEIDRDRYRRHVTVQA